MTLNEPQAIADHVKGIARIVGGDVAETCYLLIGALESRGDLSPLEALDVANLLPKN